MSDNSIRLTSGGTLQVRTGVIRGLGPQGASGTDGKSILNGSGAPSNGTGNNGDYYIDNTSKYIYGPKAGGVWPTPISLAPATVTSSSAPTNTSLLWIDTTATTVSSIAEETVIDRMSETAGIVDTFDRGETQSSLTISSGTAYFTMFSPLQSTTVNSITVQTAGTAAATVTSARMALYTYNDTTNTLTLVAQTANDTTLFTSAATVYTRPFVTTGGLASSYALVTGTRYALGILVTATTAPTFMGKTTTNSGIWYSLTPRLATSLAGQTDLNTASLTSSAATTVRPFGRFTYV